MLPTPAHSRPQPDFTDIYQAMEDPLDLAPLHRAVVLDCGHSLSEISAQKILAASQGCPICRSPVTRYIPNWTLRHMEEPIKRIQTCFTSLEQERAHLQNEINRLQEGRQEEHKNQNLHSEKKQTPKLSRMHCFPCS